jgi:hypothetical protein
MEQRGSIRMPRHNELMSKSSVLRYKLHLSKFVNFVTVVAPEDYGDDACIIIVAIIIIISH